MITFFLIIYIAFKSRLNRFKQIEHLKTEYYRKVLDAQLISLRAQMNPHFLYNCLASINNYVIKSEKKTASEYITKFAKLMRLLLENSTERNIPLAKEIEYMRLYLEMESMQFDSGFDFEIIVDEKLDV